jgi:hypothetical protein
MLIGALFAAAPVRAQGPAQPASSKAAETADSAGADSDKDEQSLEVKEKYIFGNQNYRSSDASVSVSMPQGLDLNAEYEYFQSNISSFTQTFTLGATWNWDAASFGASYAVTPVNNNFKSHALDVKGSMHTDSDEFKTTLGADVNVVTNFQGINLSDQVAELEISQRIPTISLKQQLHDTRASVDISGYLYDKDILATTNALAADEAKDWLNAKAPNMYSRLSNALSGASGLLQGFPNWSIKYGLFQDISSLPIPVTVWGNYQYTSFLDTVEFAPPASGKHADAGTTYEVTGVTADSDTLGVDVKVLKNLTCTLQYNHVRQTGQITLDLYGASLSLEF